MWVKCATGAAKTALQMTNPSCKGAVVKCAARSTCGKPEFRHLLSQQGRDQVLDEVERGPLHRAEGRHVVRGHRHPQLLRCLLATGCNASPSGAFLDSGF
jgi:hypothetical protein